MTVHLESFDGVAVITIDRPERRNAIDLPTAQALSDALTELDSRDDLVVGVITGNGPVFSAGMDLKVIAAGGPRPIVPERGAFGIVEKPPTKPLIAAVEGAALAGGFEIALAADLIVAADDATFGLPEVDRGALGAATHLARLVPQPLLRAMVYTCQTVTAQQLLSFGTVLTVVPRAELGGAARSLATTIAAKDPLVIRLAKQSLNGIDPVDVKNSYRFEQGFTYELHVAGVADEQRAAFVEKRDAYTAQ